jgi:hypothetical protein
VVNLVSSNQKTVVHLRRARAPLVLVAAAAVAAALFASGCGGGESSRAEAGKPTTAGASKSAKDLRHAISADDYDRSLFDSRSTTIDNAWWPLKPGTRFSWRGSTREDGERVPHRIVFTVTDLTKVIDGVRTVVGWDRDFSRGKLVEAELIFLAQDKYGNVWHFGQYSETWEGKELVGGQVWLAGHLKGAKAGILMMAEPRLGTPAYSEGFAPAPFYWDDYARVWKVGQKTCVPVRCFNNVMVTEEFEPTKRGAYQLKYYARGVGNVRTGWRGSKDQDHEVLVLQKVERLNTDDLAKARAGALELETRARVYGQAPPAQQRNTQAR